MKKRRFRIATVLFAFLLLATSAMQVSAVGMLEALKAKESLQGSLAEARKLISELESGKQGIASHVIQLDQKLTEVSRGIRSLEGQLEEKEIRIQDTQEELEFARQDAENQYESMGKRIQFLYEKGEHSYLELLLASNGIAELLNAAAFIFNVTSHDRNMLDKFIHTVESIVSLEATLEEERSSLSAMRASLEEEQEAVELLLGAKESELQKLDIDIEDTQKLAFLYEGEIQAQEEIIAKIRILEERRKEEERRQEEARIAQEEARKKEKLAEEEAKKAAEAESARQAEQARKAAADAEAARKAAAQAEATGRAAAEAESARQAEQARKAAAEAETARRAAAEASRKAAEAETARRASQPSQPSQPAQPSQPSQPSQPVQPQQPSPPENNQSHTYVGGRFVWPVPSSRQVTSEFGPRQAPTAGASTNHQGIDISAPHGASIVAAAGGTVIFSGYGGGAGNYVTLDHGGGLYTVYMHCATLLVSTGQKVTAGQTIATVGSTGTSTGPHLHFGVSLNSVYVNPRNYL